MKTLYKILLIALLLPVSVAAGNFPDGKYTKEKQIQKSFSVNADAHLTIDNRYGNVDIVTWKENKIDIVVTITTSGGNESDVQRQLDLITVDFTGNSSSVMATTSITSKSRGWGFFGKSSNVSMQINYLVKMPVTNQLTVKNNYGAVSIDKLKGNASITCHYGKLIIGELLGKQNDLQFNYTNNSTITQADNITIKANYSDFILEKSNEAVFSGNYTNSNFGNVKNLQFNSNYGRIIVTRAESVIGKGNYINKKFESIGKSINVQSRYGALNIERLEKGFTDVDIDARYTTVKVGYHPDASFQFSGMVAYANIKGIDLLTLKTSIEQNTKKEYEGFYNSEKSKNHITIRSDYGGVQLTKL